MGFIHLLMEADIKENSIKGKKKAQDFMSTRMEIHMKVNGLTISDLDKGPSLGNLARATMVPGRTT